MKFLTKLILFILSISYALTADGDLDAACAANVAPNADCTATDTCVDNAECKDSKCQCKSGYTAKDGKCESNENSNEKSSGISFLKVSIFSLLSLLF